MIKTGFSFSTAVGDLDEVASRLKEIGWDEGPMCDRNGTHGYVRWTKACKKADIRPVYGVELGVTSNKEEARPAVDYWTFIAKDTMRPLNDLIFKATACKNGSLLTYQEAMNSGLIMIANEMTIVDQVTDWSRVLLGLSPATPVSLYRQATAKGAKAIAVPRNMYPREDDQEFYRVALGQYKSSTQTYPQWIVDDAELARSVSWFAREGDIADAIALRKATLASSTAALVKADLLKPERPDTLENMCKAGASRLGVDLGNPVYLARMERELELIESKNFADYFYLIAEMVNWAKERMVVGPARGSSCASLVCYLLGITAIDPIRHNLLFERFIDVTRADLPDIDLDFSEAHRDEVFAHVEKLYPGKIARLASVSMFGVKSALNQVGVSLKIQQSTIDKVAETAIKRAMGDSRRGSTMEDTLTDTDAGRAMLAEHPESRIVVRMEGQPHNSSRHAAGIVATAGDILDFVAVDSRVGVTMCDKKDAEELNLLKVDVLGLTQLTIFERAMELIGVDPISGWHEKLPLDDPLAFEVLNKHKLCGVFQFDGKAMRNLSKQIIFETLEDIVAAGALVRPGPMSSGNTERWVERRAGRETAQYDHPLLEPYLKDTFGIPAYQEQVLQIGREVGDLSWEEVTKLRQAMSKSLGKEFFAQFADKWISGAEAKGMPHDIADKFFYDMTNFGAWAFNKAHSVAYAYVSYWSAWWKAHHPVEYACACLDSEGDPSKQIEMLRELHAEGIEYVPVDPLRSGERWTPHEEGNRKFVLGPLSNVVGIGPTKRNQIIKAREEGKPLTGSLAKLMENPRTMIDTLFPISDWLGKRFPNGGLASEMNIVTKPTPVEKIKPGFGDVLVIAMPSRIMPKDENEPVKVAKRGGRMVYPSSSLVLFLKDDSGEVLAKVSPRSFVEVGKPVLERGKVNKAVYAVRGRVDNNFRMIWVDRVRYLGDLGS